MGFNRIFKVKTKNQFKSLYLNVGPTKTTYLTNQFNVD